MDSKANAHWLWALVLAEGLCAIDGLIIWLLGLPWRSALADAMLFEGAILFVAGGIIDFSRSLTLAHIRGLRAYRPIDPPPRIKTPGQRYILLIAGLLLCVQAMLTVYVFPAPGVGSP